VTTPALLSEFGFETLRDLPNFEKLKDAGLLSKGRLLAGEIPVSVSAPEAETSLSEDGDGGVSVTSSSTAWK
jgi:segregation and condensation protein B